jgi:phage terminase large subunit-like protein
MTPYLTSLPSCSFCQSPVKSGKRLKDGKLLCRACEVCIFFETRLTLTADFAGKPFRLMPWVREILRDLFGTLDDEGKRQYRDIYLEVPKKNTKTTLCAGLVVYRLASVETTGAEIYSAATTKDQAGQVFRAAAQMVRANPALSSRFKILASTKRILRKDDPSSFYASLSADGDIHDGIQPCFVVRDELHRWKTHRALELNEVLERGMITRRESMVIDITTAGVKDESPLCWRRHEYTRQIKAGVFTDERFYGRIWAASEEKLRTDPAYWHSRAARVEANPSHEDNGGYLRDDVLEALATKARNDPMLEADYKRYHLNYWGQRATRWMPSDKWALCRAETRPVVDRLCYAGLDLSSTTDLSALVLVFPDERDGSYDVLPFFWMPEAKVQLMELRDHVPYSEWVRNGYIEAVPGEVVRQERSPEDMENGIHEPVIRDRIEWAREMFDFAELAYDPWNANEFAQHLIDSGLQCVPIRQGFQSLSAPMKKVMELVLDRKVRHANHPVLAWNADCVEARDDGNDNIRPEKPDRKTSNKRIDGIVALIMAIDRATRNEGAGIIHTGVRTIG